MFDKNEKELETLIQIRLCNIWNLALKMCYTHIIKSEKRKTKGGIELTNQENIKTVGEKENYKYLRILEVDTIKLAKN